MQTQSASDVRVTVNQMAVLSQYGRVMLSIQLLETQLAGTAMLASVKNPHASPRRVKLRRAISRVVGQAVHSNFKASAAENRDKAARVLPPDLLQEIDTAIKWRNRLAHRYLREKIVGSPDGQFASGTYNELIQLTHAFDGLGKRLNQENQRITSSWPKDDQPPQAVADALENAAWTMLRGEPPER